MAEPIHMTRNTRSQWQYILDQWYGNVKFETVVQRLVNKSNLQLKDSLAVQKMYDGSAASSVWQGRTIVHYRRANDTTSGKVTIHNWHEESMWRKANDQNGKRWYSTGQSSRKTNIEVEQDSIQHGVFVLNTTFGALMAEMGLGANGFDAVRGKGGKGRRRIKVQRDKPYAAKKRYVPDWVPGKGHAHRPTAKRQLSFLARAISKFAADTYGYKMATWLIYGMSSIFEQGAQRAVQTTFDSYGNINFHIEADGHDISLMPQPKK